MLDLHSVGFMGAALLLLAMTLLPLLRIPAWWIRGFDFPRLQLATLSFLFLISVLVWPPASSFLFVGLLIAVFVCLVFQLWWILPYTRLAAHEVADTDSGLDHQAIRLITANVLTTNHNSDGLLALVRQYNPDVLVTLESDAWWEQKLSVLEDEYCYCIKCPLDNLYGMHVYSRLPLSDVKIEFLVEPDVPSMHALVELPNQLQVRMHFLHPAPPSPTENAESSERDAELIVVAKSVAKSDLPVIVTGDLNDVAWSATTRLFRKISGLLDPRIGRGMYNTFHAEYALIRWPLDHIFHSQHFTLSSIERLPAYGSDHFAICTELALQANPKTAADGLDADAEDVRWAKKKMNEENVSVSDVPTPGE